MNLANSPTQDPPGLTSLMDPIPDHGENSYQGNRRLEGKTALISGGDSGIGRAVFETNLHGLFWLTRAALPYLRESSGNIINTASIQAYEPSTSFLDYAATKAAINNFTVNLAAELGPDNVFLACDAQASYVSGTVLGVTGGKPVF